MEQISEDDSFRSDSSVEYDKDGNILVDAESSTEAEEVESLQVGSVVNSQKYFKSYLDKLVNNA